MKKSDRRQAKPEHFGKIETAPNSNTLLTFAGTKNPAHLRVIRALLKRPLLRKDVDRLAGCSNGPALIAALRALGLGKEGLRCAVWSEQNRDARPVRRGAYYLSDAAFHAINAWMSDCAKRGHNDWARQP
ncbi:hypothetical protein ACU4GI_38965 [Cupriavidus basilensis]